MDELAPIKRRCLKLTNCSFKKAQSGSENPATLASRPSSCFYVTSGRFFLNGKSVRSCWTHRDKLFISLAWGILFLLFRNICFQVQRGHGTSCLFFFYRCVQMLLGNISRLGQYRNSCSICGMQPGIQAAHQKPSIITTIFVSTSSPPLSSTPALFIALTPSSPPLSASCSSFP